MVDLIVHLRRNLARYEAAGDAKRVKVIKARLEKLEKPPAKKKSSAKRSAPKAEMEALDVTE